MKKSPRGDILIDRLHKGIVITCVGITLYGLSHLGMRWYRYFTVLKPEADARQLKQKENLLAEGSSDVLQDKAKNLNL